MPVDSTVPILTERHTILPAVQQTWDFTGKVGLSGALVVSCEIVSAAVFEAEIKH